MNHVENLDIYGIPVKEIPCITGNGAPTTATEGGVGSLYMDKLTEKMYKCVAASNGVYTWKPMNEGGVFATIKDESEYDSTTETVTKEIYTCDKTFDECWDALQNGEMITFAYRYPEYSSYIAAGHLLSVSVMHVGNPKAGEAIILITFISFAYDEGIKNFMYYPNGTLTMSSDLSTAAAFNL